MQTRFSKIFFFFCTHTYENILTKKSSIRHLRIDSTNQNNSCHKYFESSFCKTTKIIIKKKKNSHTYMRHFIFFYDIFFVLYQRKSKRWKVEANFVNFSYVLKVKAMEFDVRCINEINDDFYSLSEITRGEK